MDKMVDKNLMISLILSLAVVGVALYMVNAVVPMVAWVKTLINAIVGIYVLFWLINTFAIGFPVIHLHQ